MLKVYWFGYGGHSWQAEKLRETVEELGMRLVTVHEHPNADIPWKLSTVYEELKKADIIILPNSYKRQPCKSNNKLTQAMAMGKPIICDPMPAYLPIVKQGENAFITNQGSVDEYRLLLKYLRDDPKLREAMGKNALKTAKKYSTGQMAVKWLEALNKLPPRKKPEANEVDVIIPTKNNPEILDECLKSFENSTLVENIYIVDNGEGVEELAKKYGFPVEVVHI